MSSVCRFLKQIPADTPYFLPVPFVVVNGAIAVTLHTFVADGNASTSPQISGKVLGRFESASVSIPYSAPGGTSVPVPGASGLFRDMGKTIVSSGRTFRRVQLLTTDGDGSSQFNASGYRISNNGVHGTVEANPETSYRCYYFETGAMGVGMVGSGVQTLMRYG